MTKTLIPRSILMRMWINYRKGVTRVIKYNSLPMQKKMLRVQLYSIK